VPFRCSVCDVRYEDADPLIRTRCAGATLDFCSDECALAAGHDVAVVERARRELLGYRPFLVTTLG
jgi:hypothetical protein